MNSEDEHEMPLLRWSPHAPQSPATRKTTLYIVIPRCLSRAWAEFVVDPTERTLIVHAVCMQAVSRAAYCRLSELISSGGTASGGRM